MADDRFDQLKNDLRQEHGVSQLVQSIALADPVHFFILVCKMKRQADAVLAVLKTAVPQVSGKEVAFIRFVPKRMNDDATASDTFHGLVTHILQPLLEWQDEDDRSKIFVIDASTAEKQIKTHGKFFSSV